MQRVGEVSLGRPSGTKRKKFEEVLTSHGVQCKQCSARSLVLIPSLCVYSERWPCASGLISHGLRATPGQRGKDDWQEVEHVHELDRLFQEGH